MYTLLHLIFQQSTRLGGSVNDQAEVQRGLLVGLIRDLPFSSDSKHNSIY
jgi:hypothetical protein